MAFNLRNRSFVKELDFTPKEWRFLLDLAAELKRAKYSGLEQPRLTGRNIALIFEKTSTRTRCAFEVAAFDQGARVTYLDPTGSQIGHKESMKDTARVLGRMYDGSLEPDTLKKRSTKTHQVVSRWRGAIRDSALSLRSSQGRAPVQGSMPTSTKGR